MGFFRVKIGAKRQITIPQLLMDRLLLKEGDELEFQIEGGKIQAVRPLKLVPLEYFDSQTLAELNERAAQIDQGISDREAVPAASVEGYAANSGNNSEEEKEQSA